ncbi:MAG: TonB-dependent receptor [Flavobacterium sp.]|uniref:TonB-dependent receptor domain-containing protein n=1 Tax=Flavobacterium sp. TaxID=239 RepID=UPI003266784F
MKLKILLICILAQFANLYAQTSVPETPNSGSISGKIIDKKTNEPIPYATVTIKDDGKVISGGITKENGNFVVNNLPLKKLSIEILFMGYKKYVNSITLSLEDKNLNLKNIALEEEATELGEISVVKEKSTIEQKIDRKVINVGKDLISAGATAGEIMNNIPSVTVDPQTNAISLRGNENVKILIDGKPTNMTSAQVLQQIPSASIKQIELITNPSAKYNPEGMSGIINIVLNKNAKIGFNGSVNTGVTFAKTPKINSSFDLNYKSGKVNLFGNYGFNHGKQANGGFIQSFENNNNNYQKFTFGNKNTSHLAKIGLDYYLNEKNTISIYTNQSRFLGDGFGSTEVTYFTGPNPNSLQLFDNENKNISQTYNLDYKHDFKKEGHNIELEINHNIDDGPENAYFENPNISNSSYTNQVETLGKNTVVNLDYTNPLSETVKLELGLESRIESTDNSFNVNNAYNSAFDYKRTIQSAYGTYGKQLGKWSLQAGARVEQYNVDANFKKIAIANQNFKDDILTVYPSAFVTYNPSDINSFNFNYSRRVDRPSIGQVNPIREWSTPTITSVGNAELIPQFTNSFELNYTRKTKIGSITSGIFYRRIQDEITRVVYTDPNDATRQILTYSNFDNNNAYGIELSGNLDFTKWWSVNFGIDTYYKKVKGTIENNLHVFEYTEVDATNFNARMNHSFKLTKDFRLQWFTMYRGQDNGLQFTRKPMWKTDLGASLNVLKGKGTLSIRSSDIFNAMKFEFEGDKPNPSVGQFTWESQSIYVGFNYKFGSSKNKALQRKQRDKNETQGSGGLL